MEIITLIDNLVYGNSLVSEHGLSFLIKIDDITILFDTGQSNLFLKNAEILGENLEDVDYVVLSHGHYDHTGGLLAFLQLNSSAKLLLKEQIFEKKYSKSTGELREVNTLSKEVLEVFPNEIIYLNDNYQINDAIDIVCKIEKSTTFENDEDKLFVKKGDKYVIDQFEDELFLKIQENNKINIVTGCAHRGIINICRSAMINSNIKDIGVLIGGTHLKGKSEERIVKTAIELNKMSIEKIYACHCTGIDGYTEMKEVVGRKVDYAYTGKKIEF